MTAADEVIADLDADLREYGTDAVLTRIVRSGSNEARVSVDVRVFARVFKTEELVGGINQDDLEIILSPTQILVTQWPGGRPITETPDPQLPRHGDKIFVHGKERNVQLPKPIYIGAQWVRFELVAR